MAAPCCSTRSARWTSGCRPSCCARCRSGRSTGWAARRRCKVDVRILATTNRDLTAEVQRGRFREDLYFRLNVVIAAHPAAARTARRHRRPGGAFRPPLRRRANGAAVARPLARREALLLAHRWRGNVRELENAMHRAVLLARRAGDRHRGDRLTRCRRPRRRRAGAAARRAPTGGIASLVGRRMEEVERDLIIETLGHTARQPHPCGDHPRHLDPRPAQQAAGLRGAGRRGAGARAGWHCAGSASLSRRHRR